MMDIVLAGSPDAYATGKQLFLEYAQSLDFNLCFQGFEQELADMQRQYAAPEGCLLLVLHEDAAVGCVGVRRWQGDSAELKRMYLQPAARGGGMGKRLLAEAIEQARRLGYRSIRLDTLPSMQAAISLYRSAGFDDIPAYRENPVEGALYLEKQL